MTQKELSGIFKEWKDKRVRQEMTWKDCYEALLKLKPRLELMRSGEKNTAKERIRSYFRRRNDLRESIEEFLQEL